MYIARARTGSMCTSRSPDGAVDGGLLRRLGDWRGRRIRYRRCRRSRYGHGGWPGRRRVRHADAEAFAGSDAAADAATYACAVACTVSEADAAADAGALEEADPQADDSSGVVGKAHGVTGALVAHIRAVHILPQDARPNHS